MMKVTPCLWKLPQTWYRLISANSNKTMLYAWGFSKNGQAGTSTNDKVLVPQNIPTKKQHGQIIDISAGGLFTAAITDKNYLLSFGCGKYGRLGSGDEIDHKNVIEKPISSNSKLAKVKNN